MTELEALTNAANSYSIHLRVFEAYQQDKRKNTKKYFLQYGNLTISPTLDFENMNHFILGFNKAMNIFK